MSAETAFVYNLVCTCLWRLVALGSSACLARRPQGDEVFRDARLLHLMLALIKSGAD